MSSILESSILPSPTDIIDPVDSDLPVPKVYSAWDFVIGLLITLGASVLNAAGLNLTKLDHVRNLALPRAERKPDYKRALWWLGLLLYILSQLIGSTLALEYLRAEYVAPLGASSLIFNFLFARFLVGTKITKRDIIGTGIIIVGVIGVVAFGNARNHPTPSDDQETVVVGDKETNMNLDTLKQLWSNGSWLFYFIVYFIIVSTLGWLATVADDVIREREELEPSSGRSGEEQNRLFGALGSSHEETGDDDINNNNNNNNSSSRFGRLMSNIRQDAASGGLSPISLIRKIGRLQRNLRKRIKSLVEHYTVSRPDTFIRKLSGLFWSVTGGLLAGMTLLLAKSVVKLASVSLSHSSDQQQFAHPLSIFIVVILAATAICQVICLNKGLKAYDSVLIVPLFFALYSASGFINSLTYLDELEMYSQGIFACIWISIIILIAGVVVLSSKPPEKLNNHQKVDIETGEPESSALDGGQVNPNGIRSRSGSKVVNNNSNNSSNNEEPSSSVELSLLNSAATTDGMMPKSEDVKISSNQDSNYVHGHSHGHGHGHERHDDHEQKRNSYETENWTLGDLSDDDEDKDRMSVKSDESTKPLATKR